MADPNAHDEIGYGRLVQEALYGVVRGALRHASQEGLPGAHHFFLTFRTGAEGVVLPGRLAAQFPDEMTLVLQHQFWNLEVGEQAFSVTLRFSGQPERVTVPFQALTAFADPSVEFALRFVSTPVSEEPTPQEQAPPPASDPARARRAKPKVVNLAAFKRPTRSRKPKG